MSENVFPSFCSYHCCLSSITRLLHLLGFWHSKAVLAAQQVALGIIQTSTPRCGFPVSATYANDGQQRCGGLELTFVCRSCHTAPAGGLSNRIRDPPAPYSATYNSPASLTAISYGY